MSDPVSEQEGEKNNSPTSLFKEKRRMSPPSMDFSTVNLLDYIPNKVFDAQ